MKKLSLLREISIVLICLGAASCSKENVEPLDPAPAEVSIPSVISATTPSTTQTISVYLIGTSLVSEYSSTIAPREGWGMRFDDLFKSTVKVYNKAKSGASTKTYVESTRWTSIVSVLKPGDYVIMEFGHNDEVPSKAQATSPSVFKANLTRFIKDTKAKKAIPVLLTPVTRYSFSKGKIRDTHPYSPLVREVAAAQKPVFIDLDKLSQTLAQQYGQEGAKKLFLFLKPGQYPAYPNGVSDATHLCTLGAKEISKIIASEMKRLNVGLATRLK